jgi:hypothetical protein
LKIINDFIQENNIHPEEKVEFQSDYHQRIKEIKEDFPNAYAPWTTEENYLLETLYSKNRSVDEIARILKRRPSAIRARLGKFEDSKTL